MDLASKKRKAAAEENGSFDAATDASAPKLLPEDARRLMEPLSREQILDILQDAACRHTDVLDAVRGLVDGDVSLRKLFIRGLGWDTTTESLRSLFSTYGDLQEAIVIVDKASGKSKGYGFITFRHVDGALIALKEPSKLIDGRMTVTQLASSGGTGGTGSTAPVPAADVALRKVYVGNVPFDMPAERLLKNFLVYGEIEEGPLGYDKATGKSKGYALFVFKTQEGANAALEEPVKRIEGHQVTCKLAIDGKKAKGGVGAGSGVPPGGPGGAGPVPLGLGAAGVGVDAAVGFGAGRGSGSFAGGGAGSYVGSGYASNGGGGGAGMQVGQVGLGGHHYSLSSNLPSSMGMGSSGLTAGGGQAAAAASSLGSGGFGVGFYGGSSQFGGLGAGGLGAGGGLGGGAGGLGGGAAGLGAGGGGLGSGSGYGGGLGFGASHYQLQQGSSGIGSGGFSEGGAYGHSASALQGQHQQGAGSPPGSRIPPRGGMYQQGMPPYY